MRSILFKSGNATVNDKVYSFAVNSKLNFKSFRVKNVNVRYNPVSTTTITDEEIGAIARWHLNWSKTSQILPSNITTGTDVSSITTATGESLTFSAQSGLEYQTFGSHMYGLRSTVSWNSIYSSSQSGTADNMTAFCNIRTKTNASTFVNYFKCDRFQFRLVNTNPEIRFIDSSGGTEDITSNLVVAGNTNYLFILSFDDQDATIEMYNYDTQEMQSQTLTTTLTLSGFSHAVYLSDAQTGFSGSTVSDHILCEDLSDTDKTTVFNYFKQKFTNTPITEDSGTASQLVVCSNALSRFTPNTFLCAGKELDALCVINNSGSIKLTDSTKLDWFKQKMEDTDKISPLDIDGVSNLRRMLLIRSLLEDLLKVPTRKACFWSLLTKLSVKQSSTI